MDKQPSFYDGSTPFVMDASSETSGNESIEMTDEIRRNIGQNPYSMKNEE